MTAASVQGSCLCGGVRFAVALPVGVFRYCHCSRCQKATGSAHAANMFVPQAQFSWLAGEDLVTRFDLPGAQRFSVWFCSRCGTRVPHKVRTRDDYLVPAGVLDGDPVARPDMNIFAASGACWYADPADLPSHSGYPA